MSQPMTNRQLARRKKVAAGLSYGGSALALGALGSKGAAVGARRALKAKSTGLRKIPRGKLERVADQGDKQAINMSVAGGGIGAFGGINFASIQSAEARRVRKNYGGVMDFGLSTVRQHDISKAYDPEKKRARRLEGYQADLNIGAGALGAATFASGRKAAQQIRWANGKEAVSTKNLRSIARASGKTGALGLGTVGAAVAADRVGRYRKGRGRSYNALRG